MKSWVINQCCQKNIDGDNQKVKKRVNKLRLNKNQTFKNKKLCSQKN